VLSPLHLGVRAVLAKSFARIHRANLINWGIAPLEFADPAAYDGIERDDVLDFESLRESLAAGEPVAVTNRRTGARFTTRVILSPREREMLLAGGLLAQTAAGKTPPPG
jgi:aconitate hydratase